MVAHTTELRHELPSTPRITRTLISVRYRNGDYQTNTVHGHRASSTNSYETAAHGLAKKLYPRETWEMFLVAAEPGTQVFEVQVKP